MRAGCCGNCRQGRAACTMPGTCWRPIPAGAIAGPWRGKPWAIATFFRRLLGL